MSSLTSAAVEALWAYMLKRFNASVADKQSSFQMQAVATFLAAIGVVDRTAFLQQYATTLGRRIYIPFVPGQPRGNWSLRAQVIVCAHECHHVHQYETLGGAMFSYQYVASRARRTLLEVEAYRVSMELEHALGGHLSAPGELAVKLKAYGVKDADVAVATKMLTASERTVRAGGLTSPASKAAIDWLKAQGIV